MADRLLRIRDVCAITAISDAEVYRRIKAGTFPRQVVIGPGSSRWSYREVQSWIKQQVASRDACASARLVGKGA